MIWQKDLFLCDSWLFWVQLGCNKFLSLTLSGKTGDRPRNFHTVTLNQGLSQHFQEVLGIDGHPEEHAVIARD